MTLATQEQEGQVALPVALLAVALMVGLALVAQWGQAALSSSRAQAAADAAALAAIAHSSGLVPDRGAAVAMAADAGATLLAFEVTSATGDRASAVSTGFVHVEVVVELDGQRASAAAQASLTQSVLADPS